MELTGYDNRLRLLLVLTGLAFLLLIGRLWMLQLTSWGDYYTHRAAMNRLRIVWEPAPRGRILDRNGYVLATTRSQYDVEVKPADLPDAKKDPAAVERIVGLLTEILKVPRGQVRAALQSALSQPALEPVPLKDIGEDVSYEVVAQVEARRPELSGAIGIGITVKRSYPQGRLAAHVLGTVGAISPAQCDDLQDVMYPLTDPDQTPAPLEPDLVYASDSTVGKTGVEKFLENTTGADGRLVPLLQGRRGYTLWQVNNKSEPTLVISQRDPVPGATVTLALDSKLQKTAEDALDETLQGRLGVGAAVMLDVRTGAVLALVSRPAYNPNWWANGLTPQQARAVTDDSRSPQIDYAVAGMFQPGSIFKLISSCAAFSTTRLTTDDTFTCTGSLTIGHPPTRFGCWKTHGTLDYYGAMAQSCDVYFYNTVLSAGLTSDALSDYARRFGLGSLTGVGLPGEKPGFVGNRGWKRDIRQESWSTGDTLHMVIGQGFLEVTPLQMAVATAAVANGGYLVQPRLLQRITWPAWTGYGVQDLPVAPRRKVDVSDDVLAKVQRGMRLAVEDQHGTAKIMQGLGVPVAGKTGSAEEDKIHPSDAWFVCYAPADQPRYAICVFVKQGGHGGTTAAPVARKLLAAALGLNRPSTVRGPSESD